MNMLRTIAFKVSKMFGKNSIHANNSGKQSIELPLGADTREQDDDFFTSSTGVLTLNLGSKKVQSKIVEHIAAIKNIPTV